MIWLGWLASRAGILLLVDASRAQQVSVLPDVRLYARWFSQSLSHGRTPTDDQWNYPPGTGVTLWLAGLMTPYVLGFILLMFATDAALMRTIIRRAPDSAGKWLWVVAPLLLGPVFITRFDLVPTLLAVAGAGAGPVAAGLLLSAGAWVKMWPIAILALRFAAGSAAQRVRLSIGAGFATCVMVAVVAATGQWSGLTGWLHGNGRRGLQIESVAAAPWQVARLFGAHLQPSFERGSVQFHSAGTALVATVCSLLGIVVILGGIRLVRRGADLSTTAAATVLWFVVTAKVLSPQYLIWCIGLVALTRSRRAMTLLSGACLLTQLIYPTTYQSFVHGAVVPTVALVLRDGLLVACAVVCTNEARRSATGQPRRAVSSRFARTSQRQCAWTHSRPALPIPAARSASDSRSATAAAIWRSDRPETTSPVTPSLTASGAPPESPATTGSPHADASR